jgi:hypothetical protein
MIILLPFRENLTKKRTPIYLEQRSHGPPKLAEQLKFENYAPQK